MNDGQFDSKVVLIAGTSGIGGATARLLAARGAGICAVGRSPEHARELQDALHPAPSLVMARDLSADGAAESVIEAALARFSRIDALFHVAGISGRKFGDGPLAECSDRGWDEVFSVNLRAMMRLNRALINHWRGRGQRGGVILNMSSVLGFSYAPDLFGTVAYASAKAAIIAMTQHAAATYARDGIRLNVIAPALVDTPMAARAIENPLMPELLRRKQPLLGTAISADDCARAAAFLLSDESSTVTGVVFPVDAGWCVCG